MTQRPEVLEQSIYKMTDHQKKPFIYSRDPKKAGGLAPRLSSLHKPFLNPKDVADIVPSAMDANINILWSFDLGSKTQIT